MAFTIRVPFVIASHIKKFTSTSALKNKSKAAAFGVVSNVPYFHDGTAARQLVDVNTPATLVNKVISGQTPVSVTGATVTLGAAHVGRTVVLNRAAGIAVTLPAATGSGDNYRLVVGTTFTGAASVAVANANDYMVGVAQMGIDGGTAVPHQYPTANTGTVATESDTCSLFGTANSQGGFKGAEVLLEDIAANVWAIRYASDAAGIEATPFSAAV